MPILDLIENNKLTEGYSSCVCCPDCRRHHRRFPKLYPTKFTIMQVVRKSPYVDNCYFVRCPVCGFYGSAKLSNVEIDKRQCVNCEYMVKGVKNDPSLCGYISDKYLVAAVNPNECPPWCPIGKD